MIIKSTAFKTIITLVVSSLLMCCSTSDQKKEPATVSSFVHISEEPIEENRIDPTCTEDGGYDLVFYNPKDHKELYRKRITTPALGHDYKEEIFPPTIDSDGLVVYTCKRCSYRYTTSINHPSTESPNSSDTNVPVPNYYDKNNYLKEKLNTIRDNTFVSTGISFSFITDFHMLHNSGSSKSLMRKVLDETLVPFVISGGDIPSAYSKSYNSAEIDCYEQMATWKSWIEYWGNDRVYQIRGNHDYIVDVRDGNNYFRISEAGTYKQIMTYIENKVHVGSNNYNYYYFDIPSQKIRFIMVDPHVYSDDYARVVANYYTQTHIQWLLNVLDDSNGYDVVVVSHEPCDEKMQGYAQNNRVLHSILESYKNKTLFSGVFSGKYWEHDFSDTSGDLLFVLSGHSHNDESFISNNVLSISTACDAMYEEDGIERIQGTISESAFDVFAIDTTKRTIKTVRIGAGKDRMWNY